ncbi:ABC transporter permease, partial [Streptomyces sp. NPDC096153]
MSTASPARRMIAVMLLIPAVAALALWAFAWPAARPSPHDLPIGVAGPASAAAPREQRFEHRQGAFDVHRYDDESAAREAIEGRVVYGAVAVTPQGPKVLTATAASPVVAQLPRESVTAGAPPRDPGGRRGRGRAPAGDPRGSAPASSVLPLAPAGVAAGGMVTGLGLRGARSAAALTGAAVFVGVSATAI